MRTAIAAFLALVILPATARDGTAVSVQQLVTNPGHYKGESIVVRRVRCVDPGGAGFLCEAGGRLRLDASVLGAATALPIAEKLIGPCKGREALTHPTCTFDVMLTPTSSGIEGDVTVIYARQIDMSVPRR